MGGPTDANKDATRTVAILALDQCIIGWRSANGSTKTSMKLSCSGTSLVMKTEVGSTPCSGTDDVTTWTYNATDKNLDSCKVGASGEYWSVKVQGKAGTWPCAGVSLQAPTTCPTPASPAHTAYLSAATAAMLAFMAMFM